MKQIKVFTYTNAKEAGDWFTEQIAEWMVTAPDEYFFDIKNVHTNSNQYGWMIVITYEVCSEPLYQRRPGV